MKKLFSAFINFLFPHCCPVCKNPIERDALLCAQCLDSLTWINDPKCVKCGYPFPGEASAETGAMCPVCAAGLNELDWVRSSVEYDEFSKQIVLAFKYSDAFRYTRLMSRAMMLNLAELPGNVDLVMPVPLAYKRIVKRGYNQATILAAPIAKILNVKMDIDSIWREHRKDMGHLNPRQRAENIRGVFHVKHPQNIRGKTILLVDDVMTSGATFGELRRVLKRAGAKAVYGVTFCRVVRTV